MNEEQHEQFRSQVEHLVATGKLTAEEAAELLDGLAGDEPGEPLNLAPLTAATDTPEPASGRDRLRAACRSGQRRAAPATACERAGAGGTDRHAAGLAGA